MDFKLISLFDKASNNWIGWFEGLEHIVCYADEKNNLPAELFKSMGIIAHFNMSSTTCKTLRTETDTHILHTTSIKL